MTLEIVLPVLLCFLLGYGLGSVPFGLLLTRAAGLGDVRAIGSGNIGATNVLRTGNKALAAATLLFDVAKGGGAVLLAGAIWPEQPQFPALAGIGAFLGHLYPVWLRFKGGKGVATLLGIALALHWPTALVAAVIWLLAVAVTRYVSLGSVLAPLSGPVTAALLDRVELALLFLGFALLIVWTHRANLGRLLGGTEPKLGQKAA